MNRERRVEMRYKICFWISLIILLILVLAKTAGGDEVSEIRGKFRQIIGDKTEIDSTIDQDYRNHLFQDAIQRFKEAEAIEDQYFVYVDRNPQKQLIFVCFFDSKNQKVIEIGKDRTSTGKPDKGKDYFLTPIGIFKNSIDNFGYRALGTKNDKGWRGLGKKGSRVWDFGWQKTEKIISGKKQEFLIRLLMHATDPGFGEPRLGNVDSKGCIRTSGKLNEFLDLFGILDKDYEENNHKTSVQWLLRKDRQSAEHRGQYLVVGDSSQW